MNGIHDVGAADGFGPINVEVDEPVWHAEWEKAAFCMFPFPFAAGFFNVDMFRYGVEQMHPAHYLLSPYYEHWAHTAEHYGVKSGKLDPEEIEKRTRYYLEHPDEPLPDTKKPDFMAFVEGAVKTGVSPRRESDRQARFSVGDRVRVRDGSPKDHTRRARYIRGKNGVIELAHGTFVYPDSVGNGRGDDPQHVYTVRFDGADLWGEEHAEPNTTVFFDVWEPYIEPATETRGATR
jgi:nitrile hydratase beta subunit